MYGDTSITGSRPGSKITIISPNGGEVWQAGTTQTITWEMQFICDLDAVFLSLDNGSTWEWIKYLNGNETSFTWQIPGNIQSDSCLIRIGGLFPEVFDRSDETFRIVP